MRSYLVVTRHPPSGVISHVPVRAPDARTARDVVAMTRPYDVLVAVYLQVHA